MSNLTTQEDAEEVVRHSLYCSRSSTFFQENSSDLCVPALSPIIIMPKLMSFKQAETLTLQVPLTQGDHRQSGRKSVTSLQEEKQEVPSTRRKEEEADELVQQ